MAGFEDTAGAKREVQLMTANVISLPRLPARAPLEDDPLAAPADLATARYVDREINDAQVTAELCGVAATRARSHGRTLLAGVLCEVGGELTDDAALLAPASLPGVRWPRRATWQIDEDGDLDQWLEAIDDSLQHSARTLRWIANRPDLPPLARATFAALASARDARRRLVLACMAIDH